MSRRRKSAASLGHNASSSERLELHSKTETTNRPPDAQKETEPPAAGDAASETRQKSKNKKKKSKAALKRTDPLSSDGPADSPSENAQVSTAEAVESESSPPPEAQLPNDGLYLPKDLLFKLPKDVLTDLILHQQKILSSVSTTKSPAVGGEPSRKASKEKMMMMEAEGQETQDEASKSDPAVEAEATVTPLDGQSSTKDSQINQLEASQQSDGSAIPEAEPLSTLQRVDQPAAPPLPFAQRDPSPSEQPATNSQTSITLDASDPYAETGSNDAMQPTFSRPPLQAIIGGLDDRVGVYESESAWDPHEDYGMKPEGPSRRTFVDVAMKTEVSLTPPLFVRRVDRVPTMFFSNRNASSSPWSLTAITSGPILSLWLRESSVVSNTVESLRCIAWKIPLLTL